jgi:putative intracellular protease/amidase
VLTPGGHDATSAGNGSVRLTGKAEDADPARLGTLVLSGSTIRENNDAPDVPAPAGRVVAAGKPVAGICSAMLALRRVGLLDDRAHTGDHLSFDPTSR